MNTLNKYLKHLIVTLFLAVGMITVLAPAAHAQLFDGAKDEACEATGAAKGAPGSRECDSDKLNEGSGKLTGTLNNLIDVMSVVVGIAAIIMIIISGFRYITSGGDSGNISTAKNTLIFAIVGLVIVAFAQIIVKFVLTKL